MLLINKYKSITELHHAITRILLSYHRDIDYFPIKALLLWCFIPYI